MHQHPITRYSEHVAMACIYRVLKSGSGKVKICLHNMSTKEEGLSRETAKGEIVAANANTNNVGSKTKK